VAAHEAAEAIQEWIGRARQPFAGWAEGAVADASRLVYEALQRASQAVHRRAADDPDLSGMCTTASLVLVSGNFAVIGQVGDSRVYLARGEELVQLTEDHTLRNLMIKQGLARPDDSHRRSPITRAIGRQPTVAADVMALPLVAGDRLLLCTDGLHSALADDDLLALFELDVADAALAAVRRANDLGGPDNVTAIFVELAA
jgi:serine/threonine protein phosphatase PrpC